MSLFFKDEYFFPDGVIKKPSLNLTDMLPDLNADSFLLFSILEYFIISDIDIIVEKDLNSIKAVTTRAFDLLSAQGNYQKFSLCDLVIEPKELSKYKKVDSGGRALNNIGYLVGDKLEFQDFTLRFLVDENHENYMEIQNWMRGLGFPESLQEIYDLQEVNTKFENLPKSQMNIYSDGTLVVYNSNQNYNFQVSFKSLFPISLSALDFDSTTADNEYFTADVTFKYLMYNIVDKNGNAL